MAVEKALEKVLDTAVNNIDLTVTNRKEFTINGDPTKVLRLNTSDLSMVTRLNALYPKLQKLAREALGSFDIDESEDVETFIAKTSESLMNIDTQMRKLIDELFDANVSEMCAPEGTMYDPIDGKLRFEYIIETLSRLYERDLKAEVEKTTAHISKYTDKYTQ